MIQRNALVVENGVRISEELENHMIECHIDDKRDHVLTKISKTKQGIKRTESDHNSIITKFNLKVEEKENTRKIEIFNFKDENGLKRFKEITSNSVALSSIFDSKKSVEKQAKQFLKTLKGLLHKCFKKIKIKENSIKQEDILYAEQKELKGKNDAESKRKLEKIEEKLANLKSEDLFNVVKAEIENIDCETGGFNSGHIWKIKSKLKPKLSNKYTAIEDKNGKLLTTETEIDEETVKHYTKVLENRQMKPNLEQYKKEREELCEIRIKEAKKNVTPDWKIENVKCVIKELKKKKSRDPHGYSNEIIQSGGDD